MSESPKFLLPLRLHIQWLIRLCLLHFIHSSASGPRNHSLGLPFHPSNQSFHCQSPPIHLTLIFSWVEIKSCYISASKNLILLLLSSRSRPSFPGLPFKISSQPPGMPSPLTTHSQCLDPRMLFFPVLWPVDSSPLFTHHCPSHKNMPSCLWAHPLRRALHILYCRPQHSALPSGRQALPENKNLVNLLIPTVWCSGALIIYLRISNTFWAKDRGLWSQSAWVIPQGDS